jgi:DNA polymerase III alpha subunit
MHIRRDFVPGGVPQGPVAGRVRRRRPRQPGGLLRAAHVFGRRPPPRRMPEDLRGGAPDPPRDNTHCVALRVGLMDVRSLSELAMREIVDARSSGGPYRSVADLASRVKLSREELENLALAGALDSLAGNRPRALWQVHEIAKGSSTPHPGDAATLLGDHASPDFGPADPPCPDLADYSPLQKLLIEDHVLSRTTSLT